MFTGIIEAIGTIQGLDIGTDSGQAEISIPPTFDALSLGESIAVSGACLTVTKIGSDSFRADVSSETLSRTTLGKRKPGDQVNLERALAFGSRLGGHLVQGHVDATGRIRSLDPVGNGWSLSVETPEDILRLCVEKGSIAIDGISLTIATLESWGVTCAIIPHTRETTTLRDCKPGDAVNLESDLIGKYVARLAEPFSPEGKGNVSWEALDNAGFL